VAPGGDVHTDDVGEALEVGAALGIVIGRTACAVAEADALGHVAGFIVVCDCTLPRAGHFRPQIRAMARDGSCVLGSAVASRGEVGDPTQHQTLTRHGSRRGRQTSWVHSGDIGNTSFRRHG